MKQLDNLFQFSHVVKIYIPGTVNENETAADLQKIETENALSFMCGLFGGATCGRFSGAWKNDAGEVITEPVNIVYSYFDGNLFESAAIGGICGKSLQAYESRLHKSGI